MTVPDEYSVLKDLWNPQVAGSKCILDAFVEDAKRHQKGANLERADDRYLSFEPQYGLSNQLIGYERARVAAQLLGRVLVVPPLFVSRVSDPEARQVPLSNIFADAGGAQYVQWKSWSALNATPRAIIKAEPWRIYDDLATTMSDTMAQRPVPIQMQFLTGDNLQRWFGSCDDNVLHFDGMFSMDFLAAQTTPVGFSTFSKSLYGQVRELMKPRLPQGGFRCFHLRNDDFDQVCEDLKRKTAPAWYLQQSSLGFKCSVDSNQVHEELDASPTLVLSPEPIFGTMSRNVVRGTEVCAAIDKLLPSHLKNATQDELESYQTVLCPVMQQQFCADAESVVLNRFSTFSLRIKTLREGKRSDFWRRKPDGVFQWISEEALSIMHALVPMSSDFWW